MSISIWIPTPSSSPLLPSISDSVQFSLVSCSVVSNSLQPHKPQHARPFCPSPTPESTQTHVHRVGDVIQPSYPLSSPFPPALNLSQHQRFFSNESALCIWWPKYWSFSFNMSPSNEHPGLISFRVDWLDLLAVQGTLKSSPTPQFKSISSSMLSFLYNPTLTSIHDHWKNHSLD